VLQKCLINICFWGCSCLSIGLPYTYRRPQVSKCLLFLFRWLWGLKS
jgi:hypothetical protein